MNSINLAIALLSVCFAIILLVLIYIAVRGRFNFLINNQLLSWKRNCKADLTINSASLEDYNIYKMGIKEKFICIFAAGVVIFAAGYVFYRSILLSLLLVPAALLYPRIKTKEIITARKAELSMQFREALYSISSSLSAGKSIETAFRDAQKELSIQYPDAAAYILTELTQINKRLEMNETIEDALADFACRSHLEDIKNFTEVFTICKRTGGNLVQVIKNTAEIISEKIDVKQEINVLLTEKRLEHKILNLMPLFIVIMLSTSAEEFMAPVFTEVLGRVAMSFSLVLFSAAYFISNKIMNIEV